MKNLLIIISVLSLALMAFTMLADCATVTQWEDEIYLIQGEIASIGVMSPRRVAIVDPKIADIESVTSKEVVIVGKSAGTTVLAIWDKLGERTLNVKVVAEDLDYLKARLDQLLIDSLGLKEVVIRISHPEGKVVLLGRIRPDQKKDLDLLLGPFSDKVINLIKDEEDLLVQIDVQILELSKDATDILGIDWSDSLSLNEGTDLSGATTTATTQSISGSGSDLIQTSVWTREALLAKINFLTTRGKGRVLSRPKLVCLSGKEATLLVGGQLPIVSTSTTSTAVSSSVQYQNYGITLKIGPRVTQNNEVNAKLHTEVSEVDTARGVVTTTVNAPAFSTRSVDTELMLRDGQTVFLAGLLKNKDTNTLNKVPGIGNIPILGALFRSNSYIKGDTELVISLTPTIIRQGKTAAKIQEEKTALSVPVAAPREPEKPIIKYVSEVQRIIAKSIYYPVQAKDAGWEGKANLKLHLKSDGTLSAVDVVRTSGYKLFDDTAVSVVKKLSPYPPFPASINSDDLWVEVPVIFQKN